MITDPSTITTTEYLYGISPTTLIDMKYLQAIKIKLKLAKMLIADLYQPHYSKRDEERITKVGKAISYNEELLKELKWKNVQDVK